MDLMTRVVPGTNPPRKPRRQKKRLASFRPLSDVSCMKFRRCLSMFDIDFLITVLVTGSFQYKDTKY